MREEEIGRAGTWKRKGQMKEVRDRHVGETTSMAKVNRLTKW